MLALDKVTKCYAGKRVVDELNVVFEAGRTSVLIGPSGCGKSTVLRMLIGLVRPDAGRVLLDGISLADLDLAAARQRYGYVIQEGGLFPHLTARQNIALVASFLKRPQTATNQRIDELVALTKFPPDALGRFPSQLSGGQRQRVSLMRALLLKPDMLLLDEPLGALDPMIRSELQLQLKSIFRQLDKTVILVTHDLNEAAYFADEIILMQAGRIVQRGTVAALVHEPADPFVTDFVRAQQSHFLGAAENNS